MILPTNRFVVQYLTLVVEDDNGCLIWQGMIDKTGNYPRWYAGDTEERWAHRLVYKLAGGTIPPGWTVDHTCHNHDPSCPGGPACHHRRCVRWDHLEAVPSAVNIQRAAARVPILHGARGYDRGCRCDECKVGMRAAAAKNTARAREMFAAGLIDPPHGLVTTYTRYGCRCDECRRAQRDIRMVQRRANGVQPMRSAKHGSTAMYTKHKCRCDVCQEGWREYWRRHRAARRAA